MSAVDVPPELLRQAREPGSATLHEASGKPAASFRVGDALGQSGDRLVGDADGVAVLPQPEAQRVVDARLRLEGNGRAVVERLVRGERRLDICCRPGA